MNDTIIIDKLLIDTDKKEIINTYNNLLDEYQHKTQKQLRLPYVSTIDVQPNNIYFMSSIKNNIIHSYEKIEPVYIPPNGELLNSSYKLNNNYIIYGTIITYVNSDNNYQARIFIFTSNKIFNNFEESIKLVPYISNIYPLKILKLKNFKNKIYYFINNNKYLEVLNSKLLNILKQIKISNRDETVQSLGGEYIKINIDTNIKLYVHFIDIVNYTDAIIKLIIKKDEKEVYALVTHTFIDQIKSKVLEVIEIAIRNIAKIKINNQTSNTSNFEKDIYLLKLFAYKSKLSIF